MTSGKSRVMSIRQRLTLLSLGALAGLISCGGDGGDGGGGSHSAFPTTQANLTSANAPTFARFVDLAARAGATMRLGEPLNVLTSPFTDPGCGAQASNPAAVAINASTGPVTGTATYANFDRCFGMRVNGTANLTGTMQAGLVDSMTFAVTSLAFTTGTDTIQASGTAFLDWTSVPPSSSYFITLNATTSGTAAFQLQNFRIDGQSAGAGIENISITGRLTTSDGFVDIATVTSTQLFVPSTGLLGGQITMTGATTIATVTYNGPIAPLISIAPRP